VEPAANPLWTVDAAGIAAIRVEDRVRGSILEGRRDAAGRWVVIRPVGAVYDPARIERAASWLASPVPLEVLAIRGDPAVYGLDMPRFAVELELGDGEVLALEVGREAPIGGTLYARRPGKEDILLFATFGVEEVLGLLDDLILEPTATPLELESPD
jgi:hypothetical protein